MLANHRPPTGAGCQDGRTPVLWHITQAKAGEVVDADLRDTSPNSAWSLMRLPDRRIADETTPPRHQGLVDQSQSWNGRTARDTNSQRPGDEKGTPQGSVISPMLANLYFRAFCWLAQPRDQDQLNAHVVNYAD